MLRKSPRLLSTVAAAFSLWVAASAAAAQKLDYQYCNEVPPGVSGACEAACYKQKWTDLRERAKCVNAWAQTGIPPHLCRSAEFVSACETFKEAGCSAYEKPDPTGRSGLFAMTRFAEQVAKLATVLPLAQRLETTYAACIGEAAFKEHKKRCARDVKPAKIAKCVALGPQVKERWAAAIKKITESIVPAGLTAAEKGPGYGNKFDKKVGFAEKAVALAAEKNELALIKTDFDAAGLKAKLEGAKAKGEAAVKASGDKRKEEQAAHADAEAEETTAPKAKMRNAKLAKQIQAVVENQWKKDEFKKVILTSKKWTTRFVYIGDYRTNRIKGKSMDVHVITRPENAKHCRLYVIGVSMSYIDKEWGDVRFGGVGSSKWIKCPE